MNEKEKNFENAETVDFDTPLRIREPEGDKHFMITFDGKNATTCGFFNRAIGRVLDEQFDSSSVFHQIGRENNPGIHGWEIWGKKDDIMREKLKSLIPVIVQKVRELAVECGK